MHIAIKKNKKQLQQTSDYTQQIYNPAEKANEYENNGTLQKWHIKNNTLLEIDKYDTHKNGTLQKRYTLRKSFQRLFTMGWAEHFFNRQFWNLLYDSDAWSRDFIIEIFPLHIDIRIILLRITLGLGSISSVLVVLQKTNNVGSALLFLWGLFYVNRHFCEVVFLIRGEPFL